MSKGNVLTSKINLMPFRSSLRVRLTTFFILVGLIPMAIVTYLSFFSARTSLTDQGAFKVEQETERINQSLEVYLSQFPDDLVAMSDTFPIQAIIRARDNDGLDPASRNTFETWVSRLTQNFSAIARSKQVYQQWRYLNEFGDEMVRVDFHGGEIFVPWIGELQNRADTEYFIEAKKLKPKEVYISPLSLNQEHGGIAGLQVPIIRFSTPIYDVSNNFRGVMVSNLYASAVLERLQTDTGQVYLANQAGRYLFHPDPAKTLGGEENATYTIENDFGSAYQTLIASETDTAVQLDNQRGEFVILKQVHFDAANPDRHWLLVRTLSQAEVVETETITNLIGQLLTVALIVGLCALILGLWLTRSITGPIVAVSQAASRLAAGDMDQVLKLSPDDRVTINRRDELGILATSFNEMTAQLKEVYATLEERVAARTQRLETVAWLSEQINAVLDADDLFAMVVNQIKTQFNYYHAHLYLLDEVQGELVMTEGTGAAGREMKRRGHNIPLDAPTSLVARAVRTQEVVIVDNVREEPDWLPNELLPDTASEMAVPIVVGGKVRGVLDVQQNTVAGLDEGDANVLRYVANQIAVALRNIDAFAEIDAALAEAHAAQARYISQVWQTGQITWPKYHYTVSPGDHLPDPVLAQLKQMTIQQETAQVVSADLVNGSAIASDEMDEQHLADEQHPVDYSAIVSPIKLQNQVIGAMQFYDMETGRKRQWTEQELAFVQAIADQVAQAAENLRLFEETRTRASYEQLVGEIAQKLRQAPTLEMLTRIASEELGRAVGISHSLVKLGDLPEEENM